MDPFPTVISFYTRESLYQLEVQNLIESCSRYGLSFYAEGMPSLGSWELNCAYKPFFIHRQLQRLQQPVLWVDADAIFVAPPEILEAFESDFAVRINEDLSMDHPSRVMSGTIYANYTPGADRLLRLWALKCQEEITCVGRSQEFWDQVALRDALKDLTGVVNYASLPKRYTKIADHVGDCKEILDPVIEHYQASRRYKNLSAD